MSVRDDRRDIAYYLLRCESQGNRADYLFRFKDIVKAFEDNMLSDKCFRVREKGNLLLKIQKIKMDDENQVICLLLWSTDKRKANPTFGNLISGESRTEEKRTGEGMSVSIHMVIDMKPSMGERTHNCIVEVVDGFGKTDFSRFLDVLSRVLVPSQSIPGVDSDKDIVVKPKLIFDALDENIEDDINSGKSAIKSIVFESLAEKGDGADEPKWVESVTKREVYKVISKGSKQINWAKEFILEKLKDKTKNFKNAKIVYTNSSNKTRTTELRKKKGDAISFAFGKVEEVELENPIKDSALSSIDDGLYAIMKRKILADRK